MLRGDHKLLSLPFTVESLRIRFCYMLKVSQSGASQICAVGLLFYTGMHLLICIFLCTWCEKLLICLVCKCAVMVFPKLQMVSLFLEVAFILQSARKK